MSALSRKTTPATLRSLVSKRTPYHKVAAAPVPSFAFTRTASHYYGAPRTASLGGVRFSCSSSRSASSSTSRGLATIASDDHAVLSVFDLFSIGVGPSSSHTVGPMRAARSFVKDLTRASITNRVARVKVQLYGSLAATGKGHLTPEAILMGLEGEAPESIEAENIPARVAQIQSTSALTIDGTQPIHFTYDNDIDWTLANMPRHPNAMTLSAFDGDGDMLASNSYYSVGGGFVESDRIQFRPGIQFVAQQDLTSDSTIGRPPRFSFTTAADLGRICSSENISVSDVTYANEQMWRSDQEIHQGLTDLWSVMQDSIDCGLSPKDKILPGGLNLRRRAPELYQGWQRLKDMKPVVPSTEPRLLPDVNMLSCFAIAVNETNAAGGRVVTAPTNGASGVIPAVLKYCLVTTEDESKHAKIIETFLLTSASIGMLCKKRATISAAEGGCMAEIGVATSMAAAGLTACYGGSVKQVLVAAEIGLEHSLGLTCDPINGLVQVPCIERNSLGAMKAVTAAQLALAAQEDAKICLDTIINAMKDTAVNMHGNYKETSMGGLATAYQPVLPIAPQC